MAKGDFAKRKLGSSKMKLGLTRGGASKEGVSTGARKIGEMALAREADTRQRTRSLSGPAQGAADGRNRQIDKAGRDTEKAIKDSKMSKTEVQQAVYKSRGDLGDIASNIQRKAAQKISNSKGTKTRDRRAAALKAAQTRKMRGGGAGRK